MDPTQTLHDFVLDLLTDPDARSAFELDPEGTLRSAGLDDLTVADVQDVVPLVLDYAPVQGVTSLDAVQGLGLSGLDTDPTNLVGQLQSVVQNLSGAGSPTSVDVNAATLGAITVDPLGVGIGASVLPGLGVGVSGSGAIVDVSGTQDVAGTLDADVLAPVGADATAVVDSTLGTADGLVAGTSTDGLLGTADFAVNTVTGTLGGATDLVGSLGVDGLTGLDVGGTAGLSGGVSAPTVAGIETPSVVGGVAATVDGTLGGLGLGNLTGGLGLTGDAGASTSAGASASAGASTSTEGVLGLTDGLL